MIAVATYCRLRSRKRLGTHSKLGGRNRRGIGTIAIVVVVIAIMIVAGVLVALLRITGPNGTSTQTTTIQSSTTSPPSSSTSTSSTTLPAANGFDSSADYKVEFTGTASSSETYAPGSPCAYCDTADSNSWNWDFTYFYVGSSSQYFPVSLSIFLNQSTVTYQGSVTYMEPSTTCTFSSNSITGPGSMLMPITVYPNGSATNAGGISGYFPWASVGGTSSPLNCGPSDNGWFDTLGGFLYIGYNHELAHIAFKMEPGVYGGLGGSISGGTCPTTGPITTSCVESPGTSLADNWSGSITVTAIGCNDLPASLQDCQ